MIRDEVKDIGNMGELEGENAERAVGQVGRRERVHAHRFLSLMIIIFSLAPVPIFSSLLTWFRFYVFSSDFSGHRLNLKVAHHRRY